MRDQDRVSLQALPSITWAKLGEEQLAATKGKARAIGQLVDKHSGEIVELDRRSTRWALERVAPGSASAKHSGQWFCCEGRAKAGQADLDFGWPGASHDFEMQVDIAHGPGQTRGLRPATSWLDSRLGEAGQPSRLPHASTQSAGTSGSAVARA